MTSRSILLRLALGACMWLSACAVLPRLSGSAVVGSGHLASETRTVSGFTAVELTGSGDVTLTLGESESLVIEAEDNLLPYLTSEVNGNTLILGARPNTSLSPTRPIHYTLIARSLSCATVSGSGNIDAASLDVERLRLEIPGSGTILVSGAAQQLDVTLSGSGAVKAPDLKASSTDVQLSGSGTVTVWAVDHLAARLSGSGSIQYYGRPTVTNNVSGSGQVTGLGDK